MSGSSSPEAPVFVAHLTCPPHLRKVGEDTVETFNSAWLPPPEAVEVLESAKVYLRRLQGACAISGFAVVTIASVRDKTRFACVHHGTETKNWPRRNTHAAVVTSPAVAALRSSYPESPYTSETTVFGTLRRILHLTTAER